MANKHLSMPTISSAYGNLLDQFTINYGIRYIYQFQNYFTLCFEQNMSSITYKSANDIIQLINKAELQILYNVLGSLVKDDGTSDYQVIISFIDCFKKVAALNIGSDGKYHLLQSH